MHKADVLERVANIRTRGDAEDTEFLTTDADVYAWVEPSELACAVDADGTASVYVACVNEGYRSLAVDFQLRVEPASDAVLRGHDSGTLVIASPPKELQHDVDWDCCQIVAMEPGRFINCFCEFTVETEAGTVSTQTKIKIRTAHREGDAT